MSKKVENIVEESQELVKVDENEVVISDPQVMNIMSDDGSEYVMALNGERKIAYSSIDKDKLSFEEKAKFFNLINADAKLISDHVNETIKLKDIYMEVVEVKDTTTGELKHLPRQVLIADDGQSYTCSSPTFLKKLAILVSELGQPKEWSVPVPITFKTVKTKQGYNALVFITAFK